MNTELAKFIKGQHHNILSHYAILDAFLYSNPKLLFELDNNDNLYAYSSRLMLFDTFERLEKNYCHFSFLDLTIRFIHFTLLQYEMFDKLMNEYIELDSAIIHLINIIKEELALTIQKLLKVESIDSLPQYLQEWINANIIVDKLKA